MNQITNRNQAVMMTSPFNILKRAKNHRDRQERKRLLDRIGLEVDYSSRRKENGRIYYDLYRRNEDGRRVLCSGICAFTDIQTES